MEGKDMNMAVFWLVVLIVCILIEIPTLGLTTIWFAGGSLFAALVALLHLPLWLQIAVFIVVSLVLLFLTVGGIEWSARSVDHKMKFPVGSVVEILAIQGVKLIVGEKQ